MTTVFEAASQLRNRKGDVESALASAEPTPDRPVNANPPGDSNAVTTQNVGRSERRPTKGEGDRAFGAPTAPPALRDEVDRESIRQQQAAEVKRMNQKANQSTDSTN